MTLVERDRSAEEEKQYAAQLELHKYNEWLSSQLPRLRVVSATLSTWLLFFSLKTPGLSFALSPCIHANSTH